MKWRNLKGHDIPRTRTNVLHDGDSDNDAASAHPNSRELTSKGFHHDRHRFSTRNMGTRGSACLRGGLLPRSVPTTMTMTDTTTGQPFRASEGSIEDLRTAVVSNDTQRLIFAGKQLEDSKTLSRRVGVGPLPSWWLATPVAPSQSRSWATIDTRTIGFLPKTADQMVTVVANDMQGSIFAGKQLEDGRGRRR
ncbi:hypothetical protein ONZ45_g15190 [Pleurotus djamor]|nr:hypothetical protein ONZ45_g15190 [Pleurotus djamor]